MHHSLLRRGCLAFLLLIPSTPSIAASPNIVFILADDLGIGDVHCYGGDRCKIETPNIDALAAAGVRFTDAHPNASICGPTRRALMTGRYNWRYGATINNGPWGFVGPRPNTETFTLGKLFQRAGYRTGYVGKWHLGTIMTTLDGKTQGPSNVDFTKPLIYGPTDFGFDDNFILPGSLDMYPYAFARNHMWQGDVIEQKGWSAFNRVGPAEKDFEDHKVLETFYHEAEQFIAQQTSEQPFFLFLSLTAPHTPTSPGKDWIGRSKLGIYGDFVREVDHSIARIKQALRKHALQDNTILMFSSDHGPAPYAGNILEATPGQIQNLERMGHFPAGPHRGYKFSIYEGGLRVPLIATWPGVIPAGSTCNSLVGLNDLMATFAELTHSTLAEDQGPDSISFAPLLEAPSAKGVRTNLIMRSVVSFAIRDGDWKLCVCPGSGTMAGSPVTQGNVPTPEKAWQSALKKLKEPLTTETALQPPLVQLFNLRKDPHEDHNVAMMHRTRVAEMVQLLQRQIAAGRSTPGKRLQNDKRVSIVNLNDHRLPPIARTPNK